MRCYFGRIQYQLDYIPEFLRNLMKLSFSKKDGSF